MIAEPFPRSFDFRGTPSFDDDWLNIAVIDDLTGEECAKVFLFDLDAGVVMCWAGDDNGNSYVCSRAPRCPLCDTNLESHPRAARHLGTFHLERRAAA